MANKAHVLDKIKRNLDMLGIAATRDSGSVLAEGLKISYVDAQVAAPMGGVSDSSSPFLGIGVVAPGTLKIKGASGEAALGDICGSAARLQILKVVGDIGNDVVIESGEDTTELARVRASADHIGLGQ